MDEWKDVVGFEKYFQVSSTGKVFSKRTNRTLKLVVHPNGYHVFSTRLSGRNSKAICLKVHRLVADAWVPNPFGKPVVNHMDGDKLNNSVSNLEWVTSSENTLHAVKFNLITFVKGEDRSDSVLDDDLVRKIRSLYVPKSFGKRKIAKLLGLNSGTVDSVIRGRTWKHVK